MPEKRRNPTEARESSKPQRDFLQSVWNAGALDVHKFEVFTLGYKTKRLTVHAQQKRALNLAYLLSKEARQSLESDVATRFANIRNICVIGGGVAGLTFAAAAAITGKRVTILEKHSAILPLQRGNLTRYLHPNIYDWPDEGSEVERANLPILDWAAGPAGDVIDSLLEQWNELLHIDNIDVRLFLGVERIWFDKGKLNFSNEEGIRSMNAQAVVLAVGFGLEKDVGINPVISYWKDDSLHQVATHIGKQGQQRRVLVAGTGDGGLIDCLRLCLRDFNHAKMLQSFRLTKASSPLLMDVLTSISADRQSASKEAEEQFHIYEKRLEEEPELVVNELEQPDANKRDVMNERRRRLKQELRAIDEWIKEKKREDTLVTLVGRGRYPFDQNSSLLNSFLVWRLSRLGAIRYLPGELLPGWQLKDDQWHTEIRCGENNSPLLKLAFDHLVLRTGRSDDPFEKSFSVLLDNSIGSAVKISANPSSLSKWIPSSLESIQEFYTEHSFPRVYKTIVNKSRATRWLQTLGFQENSRTLWDFRVVEIEKTTPTQWIPPSKQQVEGFTADLWNSGAIYWATLKAEMTKNGASRCHIIFLVGPIGTGKSLLGVRHVADSYSALFLDYGATVRFGTDNFVQFSTGAEVTHHLDIYLKRDSTAKSVTERFTIFVDGLDFYAAYRANLEGADKLHKIFNTELREILSMLKSSTLFKESLVFVTLDLYNSNDEQSLHQRYIKQATSELSDLALSESVDFATVYIWPWERNHVYLLNPPLQERAICKDSLRLHPATPQPHPAQLYKHRGLYAALTGYGDDLLRKLGYRQHRLHKSLSWYRHFRPLIIEFSNLTFTTKLVGKKTLDDTIELLTLLRNIRDILNFEYSWDDLYLLTEDASNAEGDSPRLLIGWRHLHCALLSSHARMSQYGQGFVLSNIINVLSALNSLSHEDAWPFSGEKSYHRCSLVGANLRCDLSSIRFIQCDLSGALIDWDTPSVASAFDNCFYTPERQPVTFEKTHGTSFRENILPTLASGSV